MTVEFKGECKGVLLKPRGKDDPHVLVSILTEDDEHWSEHDCFSSYWLDELIDQLQQARRALETFPKDRDGCGWEFPSTPSEYLKVV
jgi:hypothetical protein